MLNKNEKFLFDLLNVLNVLDDDLIITKYLKYYTLSESAISSLMDFVYINKKDHLIEFLTGYNIRPSLKDFHRIGLDEKIDLPKFRFFLKFVTGRFKIKLLKHFVKYENTTLIKELINVCKMNYDDYIAFGEIKPEVKSVIKNSIKNMKDIYESKIKFLDFLEKESKKLGN